MALDHSRLYIGLENKFLENKSGRIFLRSTGLLYKFSPKNLRVCKPTFYTFYTSHLRWNSTIYHTDLGQNTVRQIALSQCLGRSIVGFWRNRSKNFQITHTASRFSFLVRAVSVWSIVWMNFNRDTLQHNHELIIINFCYLMVSVITMCNLIKRLIRTTLSTPASDVHERWKQTPRTRIARETTNNQ